MPTPHPSPPAPGDLPQTPQSVQSPPLARLNSQAPWEAPSPQSGEFKGRGLLFETPKEVPLPRFLLASAVSPAARSGDLTTGEQRTVLARSGREPRQRRDLRRRRGGFQSARARLGCGVGEQLPCAPALPTGSLLRSSGGLRHDGPPPRAPITLFPKPPTHTLAHTRACARSSCEGWSDNDPWPLLGASKHDPSGPVSPPSLPLPSTLFIGKTLTLCSSALGRSQPPPRPARTHTPEHTTCPIQAPCPGLGGWAASSGPA